MKNKMQYQRILIVTLLILMILPVITFGEEGVTQEVQLDKVNYFVERTKGGYKRIYDLG